MAQEHFHSPNLDKFVGTWIYNKNGKELELTLRVVTKKVFNKNATIDALEGFHIYKINGKTIDNATERNEPSLFSGHVHDKTKPNVLTIFFSDVLKDKHGDALITFVSGKPDKIAWVVTESEGLRLRKEGDPEFDRFFTIPDNVVLERKK